jgi:hypothetical protein
MPDRPIMSPTTLRIIYAVLGGAALVIGGVRLMAGDWFGLVIPALVAGFCGYRLYEMDA